jgi:hypothetical protein
MRCVLKKRREGDGKNRKGEVGRRIEGSWVITMYLALTDICIVLRGGLYVTAHSHGVFVAEIECGSCDVMSCDVIQRKIKR